MKAEEEKLYRVDVLPQGRWHYNPNDPLQKAHDEFLMQHYRNLNMAAEYEASWRRNPFTPLILGLAVFAATFVILALIFGV